tara:strand:- start:11533 stop:12348 length:816 start_codon:yes stop_codon:yes gene_type:complete
MSITAQEFSGKAIYKTSRKSNMTFGDNQNGMTDEMKEQLKQRMSKMNQKTYILNFNKSESTYKQDVGLAAPKKPQATGGVMVFSFGGRGSSGILYKNIKENRVADKTEIQGKVFLVKDKLVKYEWKMTGETKNIGNYTCYKAVYEKEVKRTNLTMSVGLGEKDDSKEEEKTEKMVVTAWYTPDVPISNGPGNYGGLPGLILEINDGEQTIVCTEIILNPSKKIEIEEPEKGKVVDRKKFGEIQKKKAKEMMDKMRGRDGININGLQIKTGG